MRREEISAEELRQLIERRIQELDSVQKGAHVEAPQVRRSQPDKDGANWDIEPYSEPNQHASVVRLIVEGLRRHYSLRS